MWINECELISVTLLKEAWVGFVLIESKGVLVHQKEVLNSAKYQNKYDMCRIESELPVDFT